MAGGASPPPAETETQKFSELFRSPALRAGSLSKKFIWDIFYKTSKGLLISEFEFELSIRKFSVIM